jgi:predicted enzyme related to lactoylglutathione lyase
VTGSVTGSVTGRLTGRGTSEVTGGLTGRRVGVVSTVVLDCNVPAALAEFWGALLDLPVVEKEDDWWRLAPGEGGVSLAFQKVAKHRPPSPARPQQLHLDIRVADLAEAEEVVLGLGGEVRGDVHPGAGSPWRVYADPAGHPFCLVT